MNIFNISNTQDGNSPIVFNYGRALLTQNGGWKVNTENTDLSRSDLHKESIIISDEKIQQDKLKEKE